MSKLSSGLSRPRARPVWLAPLLLAIGLWLPGVSADSAAEPLRDPTRPLNYRAGQQSASLELNSILIGGERRLAVINGQRLRESELIANSGGVRVQRIESRRVVLEQDGTTWNLSLAGEPIRRSRSTDH